MRKRGFTQKELLKAVSKMAEEEGIPFVSRRVEFDNNDAYDFLKIHRRELARSAKSKINVSAKAGDDPRGLVKYFEEEGFKVAMLRSRLEGESNGDYHKRINSYIRRHKEVDVFIQRVEQAHMDTGSSSLRFGEYVFV